MSSRYNTQDLNSIAILLIKLILSLKEDIAIIKSKLTLVGSQKNFLSIVQDEYFINSQTYNIIEKGMCRILISEMKELAQNEKSQLICPKGLFLKHLQKIEYGYNYDGTGTEFDEKNNDYDDDGYYASCSSGEEEIICTKKSITQTSKWRIFSNKNEKINPKFETNNVCCNIDSKFNFDAEYEGGSTYLNDYINAPSDFSAMSGISCRSLIAEITLLPNCDDYTESYNKNIEDEMQIDNVETSFKTNCEYVE